MPPEPTYPGVYVQETPSGERSIEGVPTSVAAFVGPTASGPINTPVKVSRFADFTREFGAAGSSDVAYALEQYFTNGGKTAWVVRVVGSDEPQKPSPTDLIGSISERSGIRALDAVDLVNLLLVPGLADTAVHAAMISYAEQRRAFAILDLPAGVGTVAQAQAWLAGNATLRHANAAAYFPRLVFADAAQSGQTRSFPNSGSIAGVYARTDEERGVWKAPAGLDANVLGARGVETELSDQQNALLNPLGLNVIRHMPVYGTIVWGSRTLAGADTLASDWKYVPVRRTALFIEESLDRGLRWAVFEPNDEPLWAQIRLNAGAFMHALFRQRAFQGETERDAYFVKCDSDTTTQADIDAGVVNLLVGFAPLKPAEFVVLKLRLHAETPD